MKLERKRWTGDARTVEVWCEEQSHEEPCYLATLRSHRRVVWEGWHLDGPHVTVQRLTPASWRAAYASDDALYLAGKVAQRERVVCPECGLDVLAGDRLGDHPGARTVWENRPGEMSREAMAKAETTDAALSALADAGESRLSLSAFGRIIVM